jgi:hypothetical protein
MGRARNASRPAKTVAVALVALLAVVALAVAGSGNDEGAARQVLARYLNALRQGDAPKACAQLTSKSRAELAQVGSQLLLTSRSSCPESMEQLLQSGAGPRLRHMAVVPVRRVERDGDDVLRAYLAGRSAPLVVRREGGDWRVAGDDVAAGGVFSS